MPIINLSVKHEPTQLMFTVLKEHLKLGSNDATIRHVIEAVFKKHFPNGLAK